MIGQTDDNVLASTAAAKETSAAGFRADVLTESTKQPVIVEFWSPRDSTGAKFSPLLQRIAAKAGEKIRFVRLNVDETPQIASQLGLQSVPAVIAFQRGQPVDGFTGALPEAQVRGFIERIAGPLDADVQEMLAHAETLLTAGDLPGSLLLYEQILAQEPENLAASAGFARTLLASGDVDAAQAVLDALPESARSDKHISAARAAVELAQHSSAVGDIAALQKNVEANPADHQARLDLALGFAGLNKREDAADALLEIIRRDRKWNDDAARKQLLQFFEAWGPMDPDTLNARRKLSGLLFS